MATDPFPRDRIAATLRRMPAYGRLAWRLARDPLLGRARRAAVVAAAAYLFSPLDLVPGIIPVAGQLDDLAIALAALRFALAGLDPERRHAHLEAVGLGDDDLTQDLRTLGAATAWLVRAGARTTGRIARTGAHAAALGAHAAGGAAARAAPAVKGLASRAAPHAKDAAANAPAVARRTATRGMDAARSLAARTKTPNVSLPRPTIRRSSAGQPARPDDAGDRLAVEEDIPLPPPPPRPRG